MSNGCQTDVKPFSIHSQSILVPILSQSTIYKCWILSILFENKYINFRYMYQLQNYTNVGYSNLKNLKNLKNYGSLTLRTIEKQWQFHGKTMALTFFVSKKVAKVSRKCLEKYEKCLAPR